MKTIKLKNEEPIPIKYTGIVEREDGKEWRKEGIIHREDGPAVEWANGTKFWFKEGKYHRIDGPAIEYSNGTKEWWIDGKEYHILLLILVENAIFLEKQKGAYNLYWLKFLTENQGIKEFPIVPGMEQYGKFKELLKKLDNH